MGLLNVTHIINKFLKVKNVDESGNPIMTDTNPAAVKLTGSIVQEIGTSKDFTNFVVPANSEVVLDRVYTDNHHEFMVALSSFGYPNINGLELRAHYFSKTGETGSLRYTANSSLLESISPNSPYYLSKWHNIKAYGMTVLLKNTLSTDLTFSVITLTSRQKGDKGEVIQVNDDNVKAEVSSLKSEVQAVKTELQTGVIDVKAKIGSSQNFTNVVVPPGSEITLGTVYSEECQEFSVGLNALNYANIVGLELKAHYYSSLGTAGDKRFTANSVLLEKISPNTPYSYTEWYDLKGYATNVILKNTSTTSMTFNVATITGRLKGSRTAKEYFGKSTDTKPNIIAMGIPIGSTYFEIDTTDCYMCDGTGWVKI
ncbi:hypothetical protein [Bacillus sp. 03113]|uniref:hypothetical protein n=1 Tax=Bacillus sp. 03113 TaxID=2578211 RepID=UPI001143F71C|nr:hypothetical protein [Bacillus sp. 03113]